MENYKEDYLGILDGMRGLMALWVYISHLEMASIGKIPPWGYGAVAVDVFMLLSGFLMAYHWKIRQVKFVFAKDQIWDFYVRRFFRIAPLYFLLLTFAYLGQDYFFAQRAYVKLQVPEPYAADPGAPQVTNSEKTLPNILSHYTFLYGFIPAYAANNILPDWSIGLEMQFYLFFPLLVFLLGRWGPLSTVTVGLGLAAVTNRYVGLYLQHGPLGNFPQPTLLLFKINIFIGGMCLALFYLNRKSHQGWPWLVWGLLSLSLVAVQVQVCAAFMVGMLYFDGERKELVNRWVSGKIAKFLGDTSYSVYLVHNLILFPVMGYLLRQPWFVNLGPKPKLLLAAAVVTVPVYAISLALYRWVELPGIAWGRRLLKKQST